MNMLAGGEFLADEASRQGKGRSAGEFKQAYLDMLRHVEKLHRLLLDVLREEFEHENKNKAGISAVQALLLYNIGDKELTPGELLSGGYYLGSNVTYNLKKLTAAGYIEQNRSSRDRRLVYIRLTDNGRQICAAIDALYDRQLQAVETVGGLSLADLSQMNSNMQRLERFWHDQIRFRL